MKHFPGHGGTLEDSHQGRAYTNKTLNELKQAELVPFKEGVEQDIKFIMVSLKLRDALINEGYDVIIIRETNDVNISNSERAAVANEAGADAFIRIHANGASNQSASGMMTISPTRNNKYISYLYQDCYDLSSLILNNMVYRQKH